MNKKRNVMILILLVALGTGCNESGAPSGEAAELAAEASALMSEHNYADAKTKLTHASKLRPHCVEYHVGAAMCAVKLGENSLARERYELARELLAIEAREDPERVDDYLMVLFCLGEEDEAKRQLKAAETRFGQHRNVQLITDDFDSFTAGWTEFATSRIRSIPTADGLESNRRARADGKAARWDL